MSIVLLLLILALPLEGPFGEAEATAVSATESTLTLEVRVELAVGSQIVVVQPFGPDAMPLEPRPMSDLGDGTWGVVIEVARRSDVRLGFELLDGGVRERSSVHTLVELGVDPAVFRDPAPDPEPAVDTPRRRSPALGWLALAAGAAALAVVVYGFGVPGRRATPAGEAVDSVDEKSEDRSANTDHSVEPD